MNLTFIPDPNSRARVISADSPQPEGSWAEGCGPFAKQQPASNPATAAPLTHAAEATSPVGNDFLAPLPPFACPDCLDRSGLLQTRQQAGYWRSRFSKAKQEQSRLHARIAQLEAEIRILRHRLFGAKAESRHSPDRPNSKPPDDPLAEDAPACSETSSGAHSAFVGAWKE